MSRSPDTNPKSDRIRNTNKRQAKNTRTLSLPEIFLKQQSVKHAILRMQASMSTTSSFSPSSSESDLTPLHLHSLSLDPPKPDPTAFLSDQLLLQIFSNLPISNYPSASLVCKRWLHLHGRLVQSLKLFDCSFITSGRVFHRFPNLSDVDIVHACIRVPRNSGIFLTHKSLSLHINSRFSTNCFIQSNDLLPVDVVDRCLDFLAQSYPNLRRLVAIGAGQNGLLSIAKECHILQELELHCCGDLSLRGISGCRNLQIVKLIGCLDGFYTSVVSDIGLTILGQGCSRLVRLELCGCEGSYDGIKAIGQCCQMLEELTLCDHRMDGGWLSAISYCGNLKSLRLQSCKSIDSSPGPEEHLGLCPTLERLHLQRCQMRDKQALKALFLVCRDVREIVLQDCWGLENDTFALASVCRRVKLLSLEGCSLLTVEGLETVILSSKELQRLRVISCNKIKDNEVTPALSSLFPTLKELKWRPDSRSLLSASLAETGLGKKGGRFFSRFKGLHSHDNIG